MARSDGVTSSYTRPLSKSVLNSSPKATGNSPVKMEVIKPFSPVFYANKLLINRRASCSILDKKRPPDRFKIFMRVQFFRYFGNVRNFGCFNFQFNPPCFFQYKIRTAKVAVFIQIVLQCANFCFIRRFLVSVIKKTF